jgi:Mce-associated membrane protein
VTVDDKTERPSVDDARDAELSEGVEIDKAAGKVDEPARDRGVRRWLRKVKLVPVVLVLLLAVSGGLATWLYFHQYRPDRQTDASVAQAALSAASDGTVALLSYAPDTLDRDFATAKSHLGGNFLSTYDQFTQQIVAPAAKQKSLKTTAHVMRAAVAELQPDSAVVLVFVDQSTTSKDSPDPAMAASSVLVTLTKADGKWLITKFDPV